MLFGTKFGTEKYAIYAELAAKYSEEDAQAVINKTGPMTLWHCRENENSLTLSIDAINALLNQYEIDIQSISNLVSVTESPVLGFPGNAPMLASTFPLNKNISIFDLNAGCTGFVDAIKICAGLNSNSLIVCSETYSKHIKRFNRATSSLFSDGAAATYFQPNQWLLVNSYSLLKRDSFKCISLSSVDSELIMDGKEVFNFVASEVAPELVKILSDTNDVSRAYIHQGSKLVVDYLATRLKRFKIEIPRNIEVAGNFVSATIPLLMHEDMQKNPISSGESILLVGFGVGLSMSACILKRK